ncbi:MAG TPA: PEP/pyruvate-binding domain-containing protein [Candidatus Omnitrophota bacterium]|nr:PEP/pyruvate-binding domain-containing protein [Candidatus Omnitrophota bacterium]
MLKKIIAVAIIVEFVFGSAPMRSIAADENLRPSPAKDGGRLTDIRSALDVASLAATKTEKLTPKDGGDPNDKNAADPFRAFLGDYQTGDAIDNLAYGLFIKKEIDLKRSPRAEKNLQDHFGPINKDDRFYTLTYAGVPFAIVKHGAAGEPVVKAIASDLPAIPISIFARDADHIEEDVAALQKEGITVVDILARDYLILEKRNLVPVAERMVIEFGELRDYVYELAKKVGMEKAKEIAAAAVMGDERTVNLVSAAVPEEAKEAGRARAKEVGLALAGGKGLSLSIMSRVVDVPPGQNVTTAGYFKFVKENRNVWEKIFKELKTLDTMDDQKRDVVTNEIRETIKNSPIPEDIKDEITAMYHQLSMIRFLVTGKPVPAAVAVRSSGTKEDIHVKTWLPVSTGSQAGQSDTFLNVKGDMAVLDKTRADFASLFTDRAVSYRDDASFLQFSGAIDYRSVLSQDVYWAIVAKLRQYAKTLNKPEYAAYADQMSQVSSPNPGSVNLMNAMEDILSHEQNPGMANALEVLKKKSEEVTHPEQIGIDVVIMQMVKSYLAGVIFTVNPATKMAGVAQALYNAWFKKDFSLVFKDKKTGLITGTKAIIASFEIAFGYGENVVGGKVSPDRYVMATYDGVNWFVIEKGKGNKLIQMRDVEEVVASFKGKISEKELNQLSVTLREAIAYDEVGKRINGILSTKLYGTKYMKAEGLDDKQKKARLQELANDIAAMIKGKQSEAKVMAFIKENFIVTSRKGEKGFQESELSGVVRNAFEEVGKAEKETDRGMKKLASQFGDMKKADAFIFMIKETWENKGFDLSERAAVLHKLGISAMEMENLSYLMRALVDNSYTSNSKTTRVHQNMFSLPDEMATHVARMGWDIVEYYGDKRDIEFAIEIDRTAPEGKALRIYEVDADGRVWGIDEKGERAEVKNEADKERIKAMPMRLYNVQARPYTAEYLKVDVIRARTEVDEDWLERHPEIKPIASGTEGENATHGYTMVFDPNKSVAWHADEIRRLQSGRFTAEERRNIIEKGFDPHEPLQIVLYLLEADPNHDPIMRLVKSVVTENGGATCHAAIFCREQGIPAVTGTGKLLIKGQLVKTGDALTVDANNGKIYEMDPDPEKRIPIIYVEFAIEPYLIPGDPDNMPIPKIGQIIAATGPAQQNSPIMLATDSAGNSLVRAEFKGEEIGINVYAGYGHYLLQQIKDGKMTMPKRVYADDLINARMQGSEKFYMALSTEMYRYMAKNPACLKAFVDVYGREPGVGDMAGLLTAFDLKADLASGSIEPADLFPAQQRALSFVQSLEKSDIAFFSYAYGKFQRRYNYNYNILTDLQNHPWILDEVDNKLHEKGYSNFKEYVSKEFLYFYNLMGFTVAPDQVSKDRAYDFAQDKIRGMPGSEVFSWPGVNPLVGHRGTALEIEAFDEEFEGNQLVLGFLFDSVIEAHQNTRNQAWFYVFVRSIRELETLDKIIGLKAKQKGVLPREIGIMIEVPSAALDVPALAKKLSDMGRKYKEYGVEHTFLSFGTNDYSHLAGMGDREDPKMKLEIMDPAAIAAIIDIKRAGYFYDEGAKRLPLIDEGADVMMQLMETVVAFAGDEDIATSLCGEAITALVSRGDFESAGKIMVLLDSFGISMMKVRLPASMTRYDVMAAIKAITVPEAQRRIMSDLGLGEVRQNAGVIKGEIVYVETIDDFKPDILKGLEGPELLAKKESLKLQDLESARSISRFFEKIVVIAKNPVAFSKQEVVSAIGENAFEYVTFKPWQKDPLLQRLDNGLYVWTNINTGEERFKEELESSRLEKDEQEKVLELWKKAWDDSIGGLKRRHIDWQHLQYAPAIIVDANVDLTGWDVFSKAKSINPTRIKAVVEGIGSRRSELEGKFVTIDYAAKKMYEGDLSVEQIKKPVRRLVIPDARPQVPVKAAVAEDANDAYASMVYHPKVLLAYEQKDWTEYGTIFDDYVTKLVEEVEKVTQEANTQKRAWLLANLKKKVGALTEPFIKEFMQGVISLAEKEGRVSLADNWVVDLRQKYFDELDNNIADLLGKKTAEQFITGQFRKAMRQAIKANPGQLVIHEMTSCNCAQFHNMLAGFLVERINPNRDYGLLGAARAIGDMWQINRMEIKSFKQVRGSLKKENRKNFGLQITNVKGTQAGAVMIAWRAVLKDMNIIPGKDGLEVGVSIATPANVLGLDKYIEYFKGLGTGLSFISYDVLKLGAAWAGVDIFWDEWRRLATEDELLRFGNMAANMAEAKLEAANKADPESPKKVVEFVGKDRSGRVDNINTIGTEQALQLPAAQAPVKFAPSVSPVIKKTGVPLSKPAITAREIDEAAYSNVSLDFDNVIRAALDQQKVQAAFVIGANTIFENAGSIAALEQAHKAGAVLNLAVWAKSETEAGHLQSLGVDKVASIYIGLKDALKSVEKLKIQPHKVVLINSDLDLDAIKGEYTVADASAFFDKNPQLRSIHIATPRTVGAAKQINAVPLALAKAMAIVFDEGNTRAQFARMVQAFKDKGMISEADALSLNQLTMQLFDIPLVTVSDDIAKLQTMFEDTLNKI